MQTYEISAQEVQALVNFIGNAMTFAQAEAPINMLRNLRPVAKNATTKAGETIKTKQKAKKIVKGMVTNDNNPA